MVFIAITGRPGVGKTTIFFKVVGKLRECGARVCGFYCPEVRELGKRVGFKIVDIATGDEGWLAMSIEKARAIGIDVSRRRRVGRYVVIEEDALRVGIRALRRCGNANLVAIDELGPMELRIAELRREIINTLWSSSNALLVVHRNLRDEEVSKVLRAKEAKLIVVTEENRGCLPEMIVREFVSICLER